MYGVEFRIYGVGSGEGRVFHVGAFPCSQVAEVCVCEEEVVVDTWSMVERDLFTSVFVCMRVYMRVYSRALALKHTRTLSLTHTRTISLTHSLTHSHTHPISLSPFPPSLPSLPPSLPSLPPARPPALSCKHDTAAGGGAESGRRGGRRWHGSGDGSCYE